MIRCVRALQMRLDGRNSQNHDTCDVHDGWISRVWADLDSNILPSHITTASSRLCIECTFLLC